jgi:hypothetical protein
LLLGAFIVASTLYFTTDQAEKESLHNAPCELMRLSFMQQEHTRYFSKTLGD